MVNVVSIIHCQPLVWRGGGRGRGGMSEALIGCGDFVKKVIDCSRIMSFDDNMHLQCSWHPFYLWQFWRPWTHNIHVWLYSNQSWAFRLIVKATYQSLELQQTMDINSHIDILVVSFNQLILHIIIIYLIVVI